MSIRPKREKKIKSSSKDNNWLKRQITNMKNDTRLHELCKCLTKTPDWKYHETYCPVWKNGRIGELEKEQHRLVNETLEVVHDLSGNNEVLKGRVFELKEELSITEKVLATRERLLHTIPECPEHGKDCVPHAIEWVENILGQLKP